MAGPSESKSSKSGSPEPDLRVGTVLADRYRIDALLGEGGMGRVYQAEHILMRKRLAVKVLRPELTTVPEVVARFEREAMAAANIEHPNVAAATDFGKLPDGSVFLVLEFVQGKNLRDEIAQGPMSIERALHITRQIASALASAHQLEIVHRDLKPENVMLIDKGGDPDFVKVLDFGIARMPTGPKARQQGGPLTKAGTVFGTPEYMAPEQALGQSVDGRADLYALGVILYEMISGVRPFSSKNPSGILGQQLAKPPPAFSVRSPGLVVPPQVEALTMKLLSKDLSKRFKTAAEVGAALDPLIAPLPGSGERRFTMQVGSPVSVLEPPAAPVPDLPAPAASPAHGPLPPLPVPPPKPAIKPAEGIFAVDDNDSLPFVTAIPIDERRIEEVELPSSNLVTIAPDIRSADVGLSPPAVLPPSEEVPSGKYAEMPPPLGKVTPLDRLRHKLSIGWDRGREQAREMLKRAYAFTDEHRTKLPPKVQQPLRNLPTPGLFWSAVSLVVLSMTALILLVVSIAKPDAPKAAASASAVQSAPPPPSAEPPLTGIAKEIAETKPKGSSGLLELSAKHPKDPDVQIALAEAYTQESKHADAVSVIGKLLSDDKDRFKDPRLPAVLKPAAQTKSSANATFTLLDGPMGPQGADIVYDLATDENVKPEARLRAERVMKSKRFEQLASAPLWAVLLLKDAKSCQQRHGLLPRIKNVGDARALAALKKLEETTHCGSDPKKECNACLLGDDVLKQTIAALEKREKSKQP